MNINIFSIPFSIFLEIFRAGFGRDTGIIHTEIAMFSTEEKTKQEVKLQCSSPTNLAHHMVMIL